MENNLQNDTYMMKWLNISTMGFHLPIMPVYMCIVYSLTSFSPPGRMSHGLWPVSPLNHAYGQTQTPLCYFPLPFHHRHHQHQIHLLRHHHKISEVEGVHLSPGIISCKLNKKNYCHLTMITIIILISKELARFPFVIRGEWSNNLAPKPESRPISSPSNPSSSSSLASWIKTDGSSIIMALWIMICCCCYYHRQSPSRLIYHFWRNIAWWQICLKLFRLAILSHFFFKVTTHCSKLMVLCFWFEGYFRVKRLCCQPWRLL